ncbi:hypothetical protein UY3_04742 [Chelonia mydas]|uniref:Uncharacterized protein n=1 Tax=Chelonia mydas TaxID=8469 RepID=M7BL90_CHEMY|nr:hypothetical protein UY3_04742 [Chelonia mydas]
MHQPERTFVKLTGPILNQRCDDGRELGSQRGAAADWGPSSAGSSTEVRVVIPYRAILTSALLLAAALPSELGSRPAAAAFQLPSSEGSATVSSRAEVTEGDTWQCKFTHVTSATLSPKTALSEKAVSLHTMKREAFRIKTGEQQYGNKLNILLWAFVHTCRICGLKIAGRIKSIVLI